MFDEFNICPYPGLRAFTEEESLYFKGRESHIEEVTKLLQERKFLMVTGASGDGKSSLIFAGLVPNARAGFFKARYSQWSIVHFRPERSPVDNFARNLAPVIGDAEIGTIKTELNRGFGSLVDLYKSSDLYLDKDSNEWINADEEERKALSRKSANLLIVVDQFEEFFTNAENFHNGAPSENAQILVNLLLETSTISLKQNLPIYVVFTMRSDFIGQCAAFRGLPEFIGYSQFFVPRLKRKELQQIIEEPATLNGNTISRRLVERLLYDLREGVDQLPILQHALNQIWHKADRGMVEMDLIHYAKVGGMAVEELPPDDQKDFKNWFEALPDYKKEQFKLPGLNRVLDIHANELYEDSWNYYNKTGGEKQITKRDAKFIIAMTFACLTKIDDSRAVRNLMSLQEITDIINRPHLDTETVGKVINYYREQGNTFIRPFIIEEDDSTRNLKSSDVLDITHESLIRNWERLNRWANKEFEYYEILLDFNKQLSKWLQSGKNRGYLLPIGPLTYFENWYEECKPNKYWINRYSGETEDKLKSLEDSSVLLDNIKLFLKKSASKVAVSRAYMKHGTAKVVALFSIVLVSILSGFYYYDSGRKQNENVLDRLVSEAVPLLNNLEIDPFWKASYLVSLERIDEGAFFENISEIDSLRIRLDVSNSAYFILFNMDPSFKAPFKSKLLTYVQSELKQEGIKPETRLEQINYFIDQLVYENYFNPDEEIESILNTQIASLYTNLKNLVDYGILDDAINLNQGIESVLNHGHPSKDQVYSLIELTTPFQATSISAFNKLYPREKSIPNGWNWGIAHNGGYQEMAYLYAAVGDLSHAIQSTDSVIKYDPNYFQRRSFNNGYNVIGYLLQFGYYDLASKYLDYLVKESGLTRMELVDRILSRSGGMKYAYTFRTNPNDANENYNPGLSLLEMDQLNWLFNEYEKESLKLSNIDERNYKMALLRKQNAVYLHKYAIDRDYKPDFEKINSLFESSIEFYNKVSSQYLEGTGRIVYRYNTTGIRSANHPRWYYFLYPDHFANGWFTEKYLSPVFLEYIIRNDMLVSLYTGATQLESINDWISNYYEVYTDINATDNRRNNITLTRELLLNLRNQVATHPRSKEFDGSLLNLVLANLNFQDGNDDTAFDCFDKIEVGKLQILTGRWEYLNLTFIDNEIIKLARFLLDRGRFDSAVGLIETLPDNNYKAVAYSALAEYIYDGQDKRLAFVFLDSAIRNGNRVDETLIPVPLDYRNFISKALTGIGGKDLNEMARDLFNQMDPNFKDLGYFYNIWGVALEGNYYRAAELIPDDIPKIQQLIYRSIILDEEAFRRPPRAGWEAFADYYNWLYREYIVFDDNF